MDEDAEQQLPVLEGEKDAAELIHTQLQIDRQVIAYTLEQLRKQLAIVTVNWHHAKRWKVEEQDPRTGQIKKVHPGTIAKEIRELQEKIVQLEGFLDAGAELPRPTDEEVPDADVAEIEVPEAGLIVAETRLPDMPPGLGA